MSQPVRTPPGADMLAFVTEQMAFVGLADDDMARIRRTAPMVLAHEAALTSALYDHLLKFPATARFFLREDGSPDLERIERRKHSLARWLREAAEIATREGASYYVLGVALSHSHRGQRPGGQIPPEFMVGAMSLTQSALAGILAAELSDPVEALQASTAWNKLLLVHLNVLLVGYLLPPAPHR
jgi:hypothetical protein